MGEEKAQLFGGILDGEEITVRGRQRVIDRDVPGGTFGQPARRVSYERTDQRTRQGLVIYALRRLEAA